MKLLGAMAMRNKQSEHPNNSSTINANATVTKNSFGVTQDPKMETKMSKVTQKEREKTSFELEY